MSKLNVEDIYQLSPGQQGMLMVVLLSGAESEVYFNQSTMTLEGDLDVAVWHQAWQRVVDRHPALRTLFVWERREEPLQVVLREAELPWEERDWSGLARLEREARLEGFLRQDRARGFDLGNPPLMRFALIRWDEATWKMVWSYHHLIVDGWSLSYVFGEAVACYAAFRDGREPDLEPPPRYRDYVAWLQLQDLSLAEAFWRDALAGFDEPTPLPYDGTGLDGESWASGRELSRIPAAKAEALAALARRHQLTLNTVFQGAWGALLARTTGRDDVIFGGVVSGRPGEVEGIESVVGFFINVLPVRLRMESEAVGTALADLQRRQFEQRDFEYCPLESIQAWSGLPRGSRQIETLLVFQNFPLDPLESMTSLPGFRILETGGKWANHYPVALTIAPEAGGGLDLSLSYHEGRLDAAAARQLLAHLQTILEAFVARPAARMAELPLLTADERRELLAAAAGPVAPAGTSVGRCIHTLFEEQAARTPEAPAVEAGGLALTYRELNARAESLARWLRRQGVGPESIVGLCVERSPEMVVGMLGVLKAGGAYLPLDPIYPQERRDFMLADSGARVLLTRESLMDPAGDGEGDEPEPAAPPLPGNGAYVIYTSGSTGRPKGVLVSHAALVSYVESAGEDFRVGAGDRVLQFASMGFDTSAEEIYPCLVRGATLVLRDDAMAGAAEVFLREVERLGLTVLDLPTAYWHELVDGMAQQDLDWPAGARLVILGGEQVRADRLDVWRERVGERSRLLNTYGPTEATIVATRRELSGPRDFPAEVPIGRPVPGARVHVVSRDLELLPAGLDGEVVIGGAGLARGYLGRPDLTAERFVPDPFAGSAGERLYRTGDLARRLPAGELEFRGRADHQVKVRGYRIELGEVEAALRAVPAVREAAVVAREALGGGKRLVAFVVAREGCAPTAADLRVELQGRLPEFMAPAVFVLLPELPLTPSGKVDRRALERIEAGAGQPDSSGFAAPRNQIEEMLCGLWSDLLGVERLGIHDNFFQLGGHSLLVARLASRVRQAFGVELSMVEIFKQPTVAELALLLERAERAGGAEDMPELPPIGLAPRDRPIPLSFPQERVWFLDQLSAGGNIAYNFQVRIWFQGPFDAGVFRRTLTEIVRRHEVLRTSFPEVNGQPVQVIHPAAPVDLPVVDLRQLPEEERSDVAWQLFSNLIQVAFDLSRAPLIRWRLLRLADDLWELHQVEHHFVHDGWSFAIMLREIKALYVAFLRGEPSPLAELPVQYADFTVWQREWMAGPVMDHLVGFWTRKLAGAPQGLEIATDRPRPAQASFAGNLEFLRMPDDLYAALRKLSRREGFTLYMTMLAGFFALLQRYTGELDMVIGTSNANRRAHEIENMIGMVVNSLLLRGDLSGNPTFRELLGRVRELCLEVYAHQDMPFERLVQELQPERTFGRNPLFQIMYNFHDSAVPDLEFGDLQARFRVYDNHSAKVDINVIVIPRAEQRVGLTERENDNHAVIQWEYNTDLFDRATILRMIDHYFRLLRGVAAEGGEGTRLSALALMSPEEREQVLQQWNATASAYPREATIPGLFAEQVLRTPDAFAVVSGIEELTYAELNRRAERLAGWLVAAGAQPDEAVGLCAERSVDLIAALLGILKAGGAYVPLDPSYPQERLGGMLTDAGARIVVVQEGLEDVLPESGAIRLPLHGTLHKEGGIAVRPALHPDQLAYVLFTSGSTGRPKGVAVTHRNVVRLVRETGYLRFGPEEVFLQLAPVSFDASTLEIWGPLLNGGRLAVYPPGPLDLSELGDALERYGVSTLWLTAGLFHQMVESHLEGLRPVRQLAAGGDVLSPELVRRALAGLPGVTLINGYGPTENTTFTCCYGMRSAADLGAGPVPIGRPIANTQVYVLDAAFQPVPVGVVGQLYAAGDGLARGYAGRPELTAERFLPDPVSGEPGARLYDTGDLARWLPSGGVEFLGRADAQVKVRGFRIEPGEIESVLASHPEVETAVVVAREDVPGDKRLVAYVVPAGESSPEPSALRAWAEKRLPAYMVPGAFVRLAALPLGPTGKVDRRALPAPAGERHEAEPQGERSPAEELLAGVWADLLGVPGVASHDSFFALGGHSLLATRMISRVRAVLGVELPIRAVFEEPTLAGFAAWTERALQEDLGENGASLPPLVAVPRDRPLPLSFSQQRLWFIDQLEPENVPYNVRGGVRLEGSLDVAALAAALSGIVRRHEVLRTTFGQEAGEPRQVIAAPAPLPLPVLDLSGLPAEAQEVETHRIATAESRRPYDLARGPLLRCTLLRLGERQHALLVGMHHVVSDGWSMGIFVRELGALYRALVTAEPGALPALPIQYADFAVWQRQWLRDEALAERLAWWTGQLTGAPQVVELPLDRPRPPVQSFRGGHVYLSLGSELEARLETMTRRLGITPFMLLLAGFGTLLSRYGGQSDVVVGTPIANRRQAELEDLIGFFVNTLALRVDLAGDPTLGELAQRVREMSLGAFAHQEVPFERLVDELRPVRVLSHSPVFQVLLALQNFPVSPLDLPGLTLSPLRFETGQTHYDLSLFLNPHAGQGGLLAVEYAADLFDAATIQRLLGHFHRLLAAVTAEGGEEVRLSALPLLGEEEREEVLHTWNDTGTAYPREATIPGLFAEQVRRTPDALAVVSGGEELTYAELDRRAERLAGRLVAAGVKPDEAVGLCAVRSVDLIAALLGILKAGGAYVPLDPGYPRERLAGMLEDAGARIVVVQEGLEDALPASDARRLPLRDTLHGEGGIAALPALPALYPEQLAYVLFTSGSTGRPKGVAVTHRNVVRLVRETGYLRFGPDEVFLQLAPVSFDASTLEIWGPLLNGGRLAVYPPGPLDLSELGGALQRYGVSTLWLTAGLFHQMVESHLEGLRPVRQLVAGGDVLSLELVRRALAGLPGVTLLNGYGPTEGTTFTCCHAMRSAADLGAGPVPIGVPIANTRVYLLDAAFQPVPVGAVGQLYAAGEGLARGYAGRPELTAERFVPDPVSGEPGARLYATGDLARWRPSGEVEFLGRADAQVKVRGFRIEPGEVEAVLARHPEVETAVVTAREDVPGDKRLVAYVVPAAESSPDPAALRAWVEQRLPAYMVPGDFVRLAALPLGPTGKVDRRTLPAPSTVLPDLDDRFVAPRNPVEAALAAVWAEVLRRERIGVHDNFFELGGDSIRTIQVVARSRDQGIRITARQIFQHQTIAELATVAEVVGSHAAPAQDVPLPLTPAQRLRASVAVDGAGRELVRVALPAGSDAAVLKQALSELSARHDALRLRFTQDDEGWSQRYAPEETGVVLERAESLQGGSEALRAALLPDGSLLLAAHELALDDPSWSVLLADLLALCAGAAPPAASPVTFARWAEALAPWAAPCANGSADAVEATAVGPVTVHLEAAETSALLGEALAAYGNTVEEMLLAAVAVARSPAWTRVEVDGLRPEIEGLESVGVVGCLAAPVRVQVDELSAPGDALKAAKESLRCALRLGAPVADEPVGPPDVALRWTPPLAAFQAERLAAPPAADAGPLRLHCRLEGGRLRADWTATAVCQPEDLERLAGRFREQLSALIRHCQSAEAGGFTPSDFPGSNLDQAELDELLAQLGPSVE